MSEKQREKKREDLSEMEAQLKRALADYANLKRRFEREKEKVIKYANEALLLNLVGVIEGLEMTLNQLRSVLRQAGFEEIEVKEGDQFDGKIMEAIDGEGKKVKEVLASGYKLHDKVVKPARVRVGDS